MYESPSIGKSESSDILGETQRTEDAVNELRRKSFSNPVATNIKRHKITNISDNEEVLKGKLYENIEPSAKKIKIQIKVNKGFTSKNNSKEQRKQVMFNSKQKQLEKQATKSDVEKRDDVKKRVQKHRAKMTQEKLEEKRRKDRERYANKKKTGMLKNISDLAPKKQKQKRKDWKINSARYRRKIRLQKQNDRFLQENSPPTTDDEQSEDQPVSNNVIPNVDYVDGSKEKPREEQIIEINVNRKKTAGRRRVRKDRASCYRKLKEAERQIIKLRRSLERYKKQISRQKLKSKQKFNKITDCDSPETRINKLTSDINVLPKNIKRRLVFGEVLADQLSENAKSLQLQKDREAFHKVISGRVLKRYKLVGYAKNIISYKMHRKRIYHTNLSQSERKKRNSIMIKKIVQSIQDFMEKDENSRMCPGKKDFVVKHKIKKQKRIMLDSFKNLHKKYLASKESFKISLATFWRNRPFWVVVPKLSDRDTCGCIKHSNMHLLTMSLYNAKLINTKQPDYLIKDLVCSEKEINCMLRKCTKCKHRTLTLKTDDMRKKYGKISFKQWESTSENRAIKGESKKIKRTIKSEKHTTVEEIMKLLNNRMRDYMKHVFFMRHQQREMQKIKNNVQNDEIIIQIDFSENYIAKCEEEIQSMHFGASKKQISLHTGLYYYRQLDDSVVKNQCFCSVSDNLDHQSHAVWAHLDGILLELSKKFPDTTRLVFFSDGPTSQYKNRNNCHFLITNVPKYFKKLQELSWNFSESGHGKGPMDGVGGSLKRKADRLVLQGADITCAREFCTKLMGSTIKVWEVPSKEIEQMKKKLPRHIPPVPNIMATHQLTWTNKTPTKLFLRSLSCFTCKFDDLCVHYTLNPPSVSLVLKKKGILFKNQPNDFSINFNGLSALTFTLETYSKSTCKQQTPPGMEEQVLSVDTGDSIQRTLRKDNSIL